MSSLKVMSVNSMSKARAAKSGRLPVISWVKTLLKYLLSVSALSLLQSAVWPSDEESVGIPAFDLVLLFTYL